VDVGVPQLAMHSIREMCGVDDIATAYHHFLAFYRWGRQIQFLSFLLFFGFDLQSRNRFVKGICRSTLALPNAASWIRSMLVPSVTRACARAVRGTSSLMTACGSRGEAPPTTHSRVTPPSWELILETR
jgi:hypothetical protein